MPKQELNRPQIAGLLVNLRGLCPPHRVDPVSRAVETGALDPTVDDPSVLSSRYVRLVMKAAREEVLPVPWRSIPWPRLRLWRRLRVFRTTRRRPERARVAAPPRP